MTSLSPPARPDVNRRLLGWALLAVVAVVAVMAIFLGFIDKASAHTPTIDPGCSGLTVDLTDYPEGTALFVTIDGNTAIIAVNGAHHQTFPWAPGVSHLWRVRIDTSPDRYDLDQNGSHPPCQSTSSTSTMPPGSSSTSSTTAPSTTIAASPTTTSPASSTVPGSSSTSTTVAPRNTIGPELPGGSTSSLPTTRPTSPPSITSPADPLPTVAPLPDDCIEGTTRWTMLPCTPPTSTPTAATSTPSTQPSETSPSSLPAGLLPVAYLPTTGTAAKVIVGLAFAVLLAGFCLRLIARRNPRLRP